MSDDKLQNIGGDYFNNGESLALIQPVPLTLHPAEVYLRSLGEGSRRTMREALNAIAKLLTDNKCDATTLDWSKLKYQHTAIVRSILMEKYSPAMANKMICALRRTLKEAWRLELMTREEYARAADIASVRGKSLLKGRALGEKEISKLWDDCKNDNSNLGARDAALLGVLAVGLRRSEVTHLDYSDFKSRTRSLNIRETKGNSERIVYLPTEAAQVIREWLLVRGNIEGPLFYPLSKGHRIMHRRMSEQGILRALVRRGERAGVKGFTPHDFRRTFIGDLLDAGADIVTVQKLAGHASPNTTSKYDRRGEDAKKRAIDLLNLPILQTVNKRKPKESILKCPNCKSKEVNKDGFQVLADGNKHQRYRCKECDYAFTPLLSVPDK
ncbi:MAG: tyrosine-type recombinase/integrase [Richelia sp. RM2_1_2]|nr:tyrosine-type recombinase/integrase [Richelia sp. SM1_7_0]NJN13469.1 tyrosine-type recombinase/integrase [Richelia sp. RM1_1_1]NJO26872.1 tyrosine-type recombinase/integrase [Richelia sp. SL_2_1]NJO58733.1 tyrosine-type recombinase/integrase [Richelia sp. RM2_1_2]